MKQNKFEKTSVEKNIDEFLITTFTEFMEVAASLYNKFIEIKSDYNATKRLGHREANQIISSRAASERQNRDLVENVSATIATITSINVGEQKSLTENIQSLKSENTKIGELNVDLQNIVGLLNKLCLSTNEEIEPLVNELQNTIKALEPSLTSIDQSSDRVNNTGIQLLEILKPYISLIDKFKAEEEERKKKINGLTVILEEVSTAFNNAKLSEERFELMQKTLETQHASELASLNSELNANSIRLSRSIEENQKLKDEITRLTKQERKLQDPSEVTELKKELSDNSQRLSKVLEENQRLKNKVIKFTELCQKFKDDNTKRPPSPNKLTMF